MRKKIKFYLYIVGGISILLTAILTMYVYYGLIEQQTKKDLESYAQLIEQNYTIANQNILLKNTKDSEIRVTLIDSNGRVIYESDADVNYMDNHKDRPEIIAAQRTGSGEAIRYSKTLENDTLYYAILLEDSNILRISRQTHSILNLFLGVLPLIIGIGMIVFILCLLISNALAERIIYPIEKAAEDIESVEDNIIYDELIPFVRQIKMQNKHILRQMEHIEQEKNKIHIIMEKMSEGFLLLSIDKVILTIIIVQLVY